jgi:hypothetical protein
LTCSSYRIESISHDEEVVWSAEVVSDSDSDVYVTAEVSVPSKSRQSDTTRHRDKDKHKSKKKKRKRSKRKARPEVKLTKFSKLRHFSATKTVRTGQVGSMILTFIWLFIISFYYFLTDGNLGGCSC